LDMFKIALSDETGIALGRILRYRHTTFVVQPFATYMGHFKISVCKALISSDSADLTLKSD